MDVSKDGAIKDGFFYFDFTGIPAVVTFNGEEPTILSHVVHGPVCWGVEVAKGVKIRWLKIDEVQK